MSADTGCNVNVIGSNMAIVAVGPNPGNTPIGGAEKDADQTIKQITGRCRDR